MGTDDVGVDDEGHLTWPGWEELRGEGQEVSPSKAFSSITLNPPPPLTAPPPDCQSASLPFMMEGLHPGAELPLYDWVAL